MPVNLSYDPATRTLLTRSTGVVDAATRRDAEDRALDLAYRHRPLYWLMDFRDLSESNTRQEQEEGFQRIDAAIGTDERIEGFAGLKRVALVRSAFFPETRRLVDFLKAAGLETREFLALHDARAWLYRDEDDGAAD